MSDKTDNNDPEIINGSGDQPKQANLPGDTSILQHVGKYQIKGLLGRGSTGVVYLGLDPQLQRKVAIKVLHVARGGASGETPTNFASNQSLVKRFLAEAQSTGKLRHQNIIALYEGSVNGPVPYLVMEYVEGATLDALLKSGRKYSNPELLALLSQLADAIDYAHSQGVLHRDIKPANILIDRLNKPYILDFGVAKIHEQISSEDEGVRTTSVLGTPAYMSPEQIRNKPLNNKSDLFAFAIVAFQCLCGLRPFEGDTFTAVATSILEKIPKSVSLFRDDLSIEVDAVFLKALAKDRASRYESARDFIDALDKAVKITIKPGAKVSKEDIPPFPPEIIAMDIGTVRDLAARAASLNADKLEASASLKTKELKFISEEQNSDQENLGFKVPSFAFYLFFAGVLIGVVSIGFYFFWPRRTVMLIAGSELQDLATVSVQVANSQAESDQLPQAEIKEQQDQFKIREEAASKDLIATILNAGPDEGQIAELLSQLKERSLLPYDLDVRPLLGHPKFLVKVAALKILIESKDSADTQAILPLLDDTDPLVRGFAAKALGVLAGSDYSKVLASKASEEKVPEVIRALEKAIERIAERGQ